MTYSTDKRIAANLVEITAGRAKEVIEMNRRGEKPLSLSEDANNRPASPHNKDLADGDLSRFDNAKKKKKKKKSQGNNRQQNNGKPQGNGKPQQQGGNKPQGKKRHAPTQDNANRLDNGNK